MKKRTLPSRRYIPQGTDFKNISNKKLKLIQYTLNARPREKLQFKSPKSRQNLASSNSLPNFALVVGLYRMVIACELQQLPAPRMQVYEESTKVSLFSQLRFSNISTEDKIWSTYLHACIKYLEGDAMTNSSLRERFGLKATSSGSASRLIKETLEQRFIKPLEPGTARRYMRYIPAWA